MMPRHMVERTFPDSFEIPLNAQGAARCVNVVGNNADSGATWVHSYVSEGQRKTDCL